MLGKPSLILKVFCYIIVTVMFVMIAIPAVAWLIKTRPWTAISPDDHARILLQVSGLFMAWTTVALLGRRWAIFRMSWLPNNAKSIILNGITAIITATAAVFLGGARIASLLLPAFIGGMIGGVVMALVLSRVRVSASDEQESYRPNRDRTIH